MHIIHMYVICFTFGNILLFSLVQAVLTLGQKYFKTQAHDMLSSLFSPQYLVFILPL